MIPPGLLPRTRAEAREDALIVGAGLVVVAGALASMILIDRAAGALYLPLAYGLGLWTQARYDRPELEALAADLEGEARARRLLQAQVEAAPIEALEAPTEIH